MSATSTPSYRHCEVRTRAFTGAGRLTMLPYSQSFLSSSLSSIYSEISLCLGDSFLQRYCFAGRLRFSSCSGVVPIRPGENPRAYAPQFMGSFWAATSTSHALQVESSASVSNADNPGRGSPCAAAKPTVSPWHIGWQRAFQRHALHPHTQPTNTLLFSTTTACIRLNISYLPLLLPSFNRYGPNSRTASRPEEGAGFGAKGERYASRYMKSCTFADR